MVTDLKVEEILAVGIDPAKATHAIAAVRYPDRLVYSGDIPNTPAGILGLDETMVTLAQREGLALVYAPEDVTQYGALLAQMLEGRGRIVKHVLPTKVSLQKAFYGDDKNDPVDARSAAEVALREFETIEKGGEKNDLHDALRSAVNHRNKLVDMKRDLKNQLHQELYSLWGCAYSEFFSDIGGTTALAFWAMYLSPRHIKKTTVSKIKRFIYEKSNHTIGKNESLEKARTILNTARAYPELSCEAAMKFKEATVKSIVAILKSIDDEMPALGKELEKLVPLTGFQLETIPGIGIARAAEIISIAGDIERFESRDKFAKYNGTAPREYSSGKRKKHYPSWSFNRKLKKVMMGLAVSAVQCNPISKAYYERQIQRGKTKGQAYKCLARRFSDIVYAMMRAKSAYDPHRHANNVNKNPNDRNREDKPSESAACV